MRGIHGNLTRWQAERDEDEARDLRDLDHWEGRRRAIQDRYEREYDKYGPSQTERVNQGRGYYE